MADGVNPKCKTTRAAASSHRGPDVDIEADRTNDAQFTVFFLASAHAIVKPAPSSVSRYSVILCKTYVACGKFSRLPHSNGLGIVRARRMNIKNGRQENRSS